MADIQKQNISVTPGSLQIEMSGGYITAISGRPIAGGSGGGTQTEKYYGDNINVQINYDSNTISLTPNTTALIYRDIPTKVSDLTDSASYPKKTYVDNTFQTKDDMSAYWTSAKTTEVFAEEISTLVGLIDGKQEKLTFAYDNDKISAINGSALAGQGGAGGDYAAGTDLKIENNIISVDTNGNPNNTASNTRNFVEGSWTEASGYNSHAEGMATTAYGYAVHAQGMWTKFSSSKWSDSTHETPIDIYWADGAGATVEGYCNATTSCPMSGTEGQSNYGPIHGGVLKVIGNGNVVHDQSVDPDAHVHTLQPSDALIIFKDGTISAFGDIYNNGKKYVTEDSISSYNVTAQQGVEVTPTYDSTNKTITFGISITSTPVVTDTTLSGYNGIAAAKDSDISGQWNVGLTNAMLNTINGKLDSSVAAQTYQPKGDYLSANALTNYYTKSETSGATELSTEFSKYIQTISTGVGLSGNGKTTALGIDTAAAINLSNGSAKSAVSAESATNALSSRYAKQLQDASKIIEIKDVTALQNWASSNSSTWEGVTAKLGTAQYAIDSATFVTSSISTITGTKQYALTTAGWAEVQGGSTFTGVTTTGSISGGGVNNDTIGLLTSAENALTAVANKVDKPDTTQTVLNNNYLIYSTLTGEGTTTGWMPLSANYYSKTEADGRYVATADVGAGLYYSGSSPKLGVKLGTDLAFDSNGFVQVNVGGNNIVDSSHYAFIVGVDHTASGQGAFAGGYGTHTSGVGNFIYGTYLSFDSGPNYDAVSNTPVFVGGTLNATTAQDYNDHGGYLQIMGNGTYQSQGQGTRSDAYILYRDGSITAAGKISANGMFAVDSAATLIGASRQTSSHYGVDNTALGTTWMGVGGDGMHQGFIKYTDGGDVGALDSNSTIQLNFKPSTNNFDSVQVQINGNNVGYLIPAVTSTTTAGLTDDGILHIIIES